MRYDSHTLMIDLAILGLLTDNDLHGYELRKRLGELLGLRPVVSFGSLYPALARLERAGLVKAVSHRVSTAPTSPMSGSLAGELAAFRALRHQNTAGRGSRGKKVYGITDAGERRLRELLADPDVSDDRNFTVRVAFCRHLDPAQRIDLFERRRAELVRRREQRQSAPESDGRINTYLRSLVERDTDAIVADVAWLDRLLEAEHAGATGGEINTGGTT